MLGYVGPGKALRKRARFSPIRSTCLDEFSDLLRVGALELFRVLARKEAEGVIVSGAAQKIFSKFLADVSAGNVRLTPMDQNLESRFRQLVVRLHSLSPPLVVRTLDAIHLANADLQGATEFVATDANMRKCAAAIGLKLFP
jgi:hypothetical protein